MNKFQLSAIVNEKVSAAVVQAANKEYRKASSLLKNAETDSEKEVYQARFDAAKKEIKRIETLGKGAVGKRGAKRLDSTVNALEMLILQALVPIRTIDELDSLSSEKRTAILSFARQYAKLNQVHEAQDCAAE
jgi:DNA polymerase III alpha subunit (gram-positive type)